MDNYVVGASRKARSARTLLLRMAADEARAERIRQLKREHPELTWQAIADRVGVTLRAAQSWQEKGAISYVNAKKLAAVLDEDVDFIMRGPRGDTPDLLGDAGARLEERVDRMEERLAGLVEKQNDLLQRQSRLLERIEEREARQIEILARIEDMVVTLPTDAETRELLEALEDPDRPGELERSGRASADRASEPRRPAAGE